MKTYRGEPSIFASRPPQERQAELVVERLTLRFGGITAVHRVDLKVSTGELVSVIGPNGAGKTTTVEIAEGFRRSSRSPSRPRPFSRWPPAANSTSGPSPCRA